MKLTNKQWELLTPKDKFDLFQMQVEHYRKFFEEELTKIIGVEVNLK